MTAWYVKGTRKAIERVHGRNQLELVKPCLRSLYDRQFYSRFHYQRAESTLKRYVRKHLSDKDFFPIAFGVDEPAWNRFNVVIRKVAADLIACIQSLHAIPDILASAVYYSLALDRTIKPRQGGFVNHEFVTKSLDKDEFVHLKAVNAALRIATKHGAYKHLAALANQSKHYSIVFPALNSDLTGERPEQYMLTFPAFTARGKPYPQVYVSEFVPPMYEQISKSVLETGHAIDVCLQSAALHVTQPGSPTA
jgi:hypothetical protein